MILQGSDDSMNGCAGCVLGSSHTGLETSWCPVDNNWSLKKNMHFMTGINSCLTIPCSMEILQLLWLLADYLSCHSLSGRQLLACNKLETPFRIAEKKTGPSSISIFCLFFVLIYSPVCPTEMTN